MSERLTMTVKMQVTPAQALALKAMFKYWNWLGSAGSSRNVGFHCDGDGNFQPRCEFEFSEAVPDLTPELERAAVVSDKHGDRIYDFDPIAWRMRG